MQALDFVPSLAERVAGSRAESSGAARSALLFSPAHTGQAGRSFGDAGYTGSDTRSGDRCFPMLSSAAAIYDHSLGACRTRTHSLATNKSGTNRDAMIS